MRGNKPQLNLLKKIIPLVILPSLLSQLLLSFLIFWYLSKEFFFSTVGERGEYMLDWHCNIENFNVTHHCRYELQLICFLPSSSLRYYSCSMIFFPNIVLPFRQPYMLLTAVIEHHSFSCAFIRLIAEELSPAITAGAATSIVACYCCSIVAA